MTLIEQGTPKNLNSKIYTYTHAHVHTHCKTTFGDDTLTWTIIGAKDVLISCAG